MKRVIKSQYELTTTDENLGPKGLPFPPSKTSWKDLQQSIEGFETSEAASSNPSQWFWDFIKIYPTKAEYDAKATDMDATILDAIQTGISNYGYIATGLGYEAKGLTLSDPDKLICTCTDPKVLDKLSKQLEKLAYNNNKIAFEKEAAKIFDSIARNYLDASYQQY